MKKKTASRTVAKKIKDKWRAKRWYKIVAPNMFKGLEIAETLSDEPDKLIGRISEVTLQDLTGDFSKMHIKLQFKIHDYKNDIAYAKFVGHDLTSDYIRRQTRRKRSKMDGVYDVNTKDGYLIRVKPMAITEKRIQTSQQHAIREIMKEEIKNAAENAVLSEFVKMMVSGDLSSQIFKSSKHVYPIKRIEIRKSQILMEPDILPEEPLEEGAEEGTEAGEGAEGVVEDEATPGEPSKSEEAVKETPEVPSPKPSVESSES
ncbi:MAG: 30S ribosomal protein S3ae [Thermoplasmata archaeon]|nr:MAG: 30S ribosomal protein S3ae [Thermoplasmata archaeon]